MGKSTTPNHSQSDCHKVAVLHREDQATVQEQTLARDLGVDLVSARESGTKPSYQFLLQYTASGLSLQDTRAGAPGALSVDFSGAAMQRRSREPLSRQGLGKALGLKNSKQPFVLDATAGLGTDSYLMAAAGCQVIALERSPLVFALLNDGLHRALAIAGDHDSVATRISVQLGDFLQCSFPENSFDVVYLDPMFPQQATSARSKKPMYLLQQLLAEDSEEALLLVRALELAKNRVVVKRARSSPLISERKPDIRFKGSSNRYDVYLTLAGVKA